VVAVAALTLGADSGGSFTVAPSLGLMLWTLMCVAAVALVVFFVARPLLRLWRAREGRR